LGWLGVCMASWFASWLINFSTQVAASSLAPNRFAVFVVANYMANGKTIDFGSVTTGVYLANLNA
jgi:hypothetical protein